MLIIKNLHAEVEEKQILNMPLNGRNRVLTRGFMRMISIPSL